MSELNKPFKRNINPGDILGIHWPKCLFLTTLSNILPIYLIIILRILSDTNVNSSCQWFLFFGGFCKLLRSFSLCVVSLCQLIFLRNIEAPLRTIKPCSERNVILISSTDMCTFLEAFFRVARLFQSVWVYFLLNV